MQTLEALSQRIATTEDLRGIVRTMKSLSAVSIRQYESAVVALRDYSRTVELALQALLRDRPAAVGAAGPAAGPAAVVVFGSEGRGIDPKLLALCGERVTIPQQGVTQSLNLAVAVGIVVSQVVDCVRVDRKDGAVQGISGALASWGWG